MKDLKAALGSDIKADITHVRTEFSNYTARACMYGNVKYERANYLRPTGGVHHTEPTAEDFERFRAYLRAAISHAQQTLDAMEIHQSQDPELKDVDGMRRAAYAVDTDVTPGAKVGASFLPHVAPACASLNMAITQAVHCGLLPRDPGPTWRLGVPAGWDNANEDDELGSVNGVSTLEPCSDPQCCPPVNGDKMPFDDDYRRKEPYPRETYREVLERVKTAKPYYGPASKDDVPLSGCVYVKVGEAVEKNQAVVAIMPGPCFDGRAPADADVWTHKPGPV